MESGVHAPHARQRDGVGEIPSLTFGSRQNLTSP